MSTRKKIERTLALPFWAVVYKNMIVGPFTDLDLARLWAMEHGCTQVMSLYPPLEKEPNHGHEIGRFLLLSEM